MKRTILALAILLFLAAFCNAATKNVAIRLKVLDSETHSVVIDDSGVPKNCDQLNYDAYCSSSKTQQVTNTLLVQDLGTGAQYRVSCGIDTKWSRCIPLPKGDTYDGHKEKHGLTIYYPDDDGKARRQFYAFVAPDGKANPSAPPAVAQAIAPSAPNSVQTALVATGSSNLPETVRCNFSSTPAGAEVTLDGRYIGSTPSVLGVTTGSHVVVIANPGFASWKRELTVVSGSELTVNAILQKQ
ncbi:MAG TPA: PEGA domain-containing protein [Terriglobales bacterium]